MNLILRLAVVLSLAFFASRPALAEAVTFTASDKAKVSGEYYGDGDKAKPLILLFHQAGSNAGEYATIAPRLNALGFNALAVDQRSGGPGWGRDNLTAKAFRRAAGFDEALPDLEAALDWAVASGHSRVLVLGSSYSASLVFLLAAKRPETVKAVLAFSPGEYLSGRESVRSAAARVKSPVFVTSASDAGEIAEAERILKAVPGAVKQQFKPRNGTHGASTLRADRNPYGAAENWQAVETFLARVK